MRLLKQSYFIASFLLMLICANASAQLVTHDKHIDVAMRTIGHEFLLMYEDSTSRVMPIERTGNRYKIAFERNFEIIPDNVLGIVAGVMESRDISSHYFLEIASCEDDVVQYSFEYQPVLDSNNVACRARSLPEACYVFYITLVETNHPLVAANESLGNSDSSQRSGFNLMFLVAVGLVLFGFAFYLKKKQEAQIELGSNLIQIGAYGFDAINMELKLNDQKVVLTGKESELLHLLYNSLNKPVERETLLEKVWGDQGDYIGRTLDVFISKLRKKLDGDSNVKIINIRGVGYKLVLNNPD